MQYAFTPEQAEARKKIAQSLMASQGRATNAGQGLSDAARQIIGALLMRRAEKAGIGKPGAGSATMGMNQDQGGRGMPVDPRQMAALKGAGVPGYRRGTDYAPGGFAIVGEDGPELVDLPQGSKVTPTPELLKFIQENPQAPADRLQYLLDNPQLPPSMWPHMIAPVNPGGSQFVPGSEQGDAPRERTFMHNGKPVTLPPMEYEDEDNGYWDAGKMGNGQGRSFYSIDGQQYFLDDQPSAPPAPDLEWEEQNFDPRQLLPRDEGSLPRMQPKTAFVPGAERQMAELDAFKMMQLQPQYGDTVEADLNATEGGKLSLLRRMMFADAALEDPRLADAMTRFDNNLAGGMGALGRLYTNDNYELGRLMADQFANAVLRNDSGAQAPEPEVQRYIRQFFPLSGETQEQLKAKAATRRETIRSLQQALGGDAAPAVKQLREEIDALRRAADVPDGFLKGKGPGVQQPPQQDISDEDKEFLRSLGLSD